MPALIAAAVVACKPSMPGIKINEMRDCELRQPLFGFSIVGCYEGLIEFKLNVNTYEQDVWCCNFADNISVYNFIVIVKFPSSC